jgi:heavy metal sensor kinase
MSRHSNVRIRFTLLYGAALMATVVFFSIVIYYFVQRSLIGQIDNHLRKDMVTVTEYIHHSPSELQDLSRFGPIHIFRVRNGNRPFITSHEWQKSGLDQLLDSNYLAPQPRTIRTTDKQYYRVQSQLVATGDSLFQVLIAHEEENYRRTLNTLALIILLILPGSVAISLAIGYLIAGRVLAPITAITRKAEAISADNLSERLPVGPANDEFSHLATVFNQTLTRLEESFERLRRFTADASHELRTPLTAIRSIGETALQQPSSSTDYPETIGSMLEETDRLAQTVESLLILSRTDSRALQKEPTEISDLLADVVEFLSVLAEEKHQQIIFERSTTLTIQADPCMLRRAFLNLLDNAIKYSPEQTTIQVKMYSGVDDATIIEIADKGPGIQADEQDRIFDRFYRIDNGRSRDKGGTGLGLSITKAAIEAHDGTISIENSPAGGTVFRVMFCNRHKE